MEKIMRPELKPNIEFVKRIFPETLKLLENYVNDNNRNITVLEKKLTKLTGKNIKKYYLSSWLEEDENDDIAFVLSLPKNMTKYGFAVYFKHIKFLKGEKNGIQRTGLRHCQVNMSYCQL
jgi:hypothetical protein